ncbi:hypothetical protein RchiOBHm_Chr5g0044131 [Rosa chinensis]|uniref:Uncharacterized protein n=1 Tax=Rosa chinensis TaxID=74649 RepID=A0A2P6QDJ3_ROSCH|nr:hypothetical protein RchiOBHm_Chr5g0044131 [Rosa chinensis]
MHALGAGGHGGFWGWDSLPKKTHNKESDLIVLGFRFLGSFPLWILIWKLVVVSFQVKYSQELDNYTKCLLV